MLNHNEVIEKLTMKQKLLLLTDIRSLSRPEMTDMGIPRISVQALETLISEQYEGLSPSRLASSWDTALIEQVSFRAVSAANQRLPEARLLLTPVAKPALNIYQTALSEDPFLSGVLASAFAAGVRRAGGDCCLDGLYLTESDVEQLDIQPDMATIGEMVLKPYVMAAQNTSYTGVMTAGKALPGGYKDVNERLLTSNSAINILNGTARLCRPRNDDETLTAILDGKIVIHGGSAALESAYDNYRYILKAIEDEIVTMEDLDEALADGRAVSDEMLNKAVSRVLDFAHTVARVSEQDPQSPIPPSTDPFSASCVLLKNENAILPLKAGSRVAVIGHASALSEVTEALRQQMNVTVIGRIDGYDPHAVTGGVDTKGAIALAQKADTVLVFLGRSKEASQLALQQRVLTLPAGQAELLHALAPYKSKIVGIVDCEHPLDVAFSSDVASLLLAPVGGADSATALAHLLTGRASPSGRLACSLYENTTQHFARLRHCKNTGKNKVGQFLGYRHYDSSDIPVPFPFGHGLSYTSFSYSNLRVTTKEAIFTVKNVGTRPGTEVAQVYIGKAASARIRPVRELCGFARIPLQPGEARDVRVDLSHVSFYDAEEDRWVLEGGEYTVYVGASVKDIRLTQKLPVRGSVYPPCEEHISDYLQTRSNILTDKYVVELKKTPPTRGLRFILPAVFLMALTVTFPILGHALSRALSSHSAANLTANAFLAVGYICGGLSLAGAVALLAVNRRRKKKKNKNQEAEADMAKARQLEAAVEKEFNSIEELFVEEFDTVADTVDTAVEEKVYVDDTSRYIDLNYTLSDVTEDLANFMQTRGINLSAAEATHLVAAMGASRLAVINTKGANTKRFCHLLAEYFGSPACMDTVRREYLDTHLMFRRSGDGGFEKTDLVKLIEDAKEKPNAIHLAVFRNARAEELADLFMPYTKYFSNPLRANRIIVKDPTATFTLPQNLWFMVELAHGERLDDVQASILKTATHLQLSFSECEEANEKNPPAGLGYYQLDHLIQQQKGRFAMSEDLWKKIDALEAYTASHATFHIGNKQWLQMEKYLALATVTETDIFAALDRALCVNLLPTIMSLTEGKISSGEQDLLETLDKIFGEDKVPLCCKAVKHKEVSVAVLESDEAEASAEPAESDEAEASTAPAESDEAEASTAPAESDEAEASAAPAESHETEASAAPAESDE
ncbi:MAG: glycoside hydrolase family 3 C-terminal domain-containing protein [Clostridia bacterium]|nr:glycoside hydrolase family 3 C-terminal domain-containing protein [Clostridia bacterium]